jgi:hypothetical protein
MRLRHKTFCLRCNKDILDIDTDRTNDQAHSMVVVIHKVTPLGYQFFQLDGGQNVHYHTYNYWHCSKEHMVDAMPDVIRKEIREERFVDPPPGNIVNLHKIVFGEHLTCSYCSQPLDKIAYRIQVTYATPIAQLPRNHSHEDTAEWCCTLSEAVELILGRVKEC